MKDLTDEEFPAKKAMYRKTVVEVNNILDQWQKYPEESKFWGISKKSFDRGGGTWHGKVLRKIE